MQLRLSAMLNVLDGGARTTIKLRMTETAYWVILKYVVCFTLPDKSKLIVALFCSTFVNRSY